MPWHNVSNNSQTTLWTAITSTSATSIEVTTDVFPAVPFYISVGDVPANGEIMEVTAKSNLIFTVKRAQDNTIARTFPINSKVQLLMIAGIVNELQFGVNSAPMFPQNMIVKLEGLVIGNFTVVTVPVILGNVTLA